MSSVSTRDSSNFVQICRGAGNRVYGLPVGPQRPRSGRTRRPSKTGCGDRASTPVTAVTAPEVSPVRPNTSVHAIEVSREGWRTVPSRPVHRDSRCMGRPAGNRSARSDVPGGSPSFSNSVGTRRDPLVALVYLLASALGGCLSSPGSRLVQEARRMAVSSSGSPRRW